ncbi:MAG: tetratricopeptide repeat protein [Pseudomonadota bacterium]
MGLIGARFSSLPNRFLPNTKAVCVALCASLVAACQSAGGLSGYNPAQFGAASPLSDYLAAQQARLDNNTQLAADFYLAALASAPENNPLLRERAYQLLISDGRFRQAATLQDNLQRGSLAFSLSRMVIVLDHIRANRYDAALEALDQVNGTGFDLLLKPLARAWSHAGRGDQDAAFEALSVLSRQRAFTGFFLEHKAYLNAYFDKWDVAESAFAAGLANGRQISSRAVRDYAGRLCVRGERDRAIDVLEQVLTQAPQLNELKTASDTLKSGGDISPVVLKPRDGVAEALYRTATELVRKPTASSAVLYARLATYLQPRLDAAYILIADIYGVQGRLEAALDTIEMLRDNERMNTVRTLRSVNYLDRLDRRDEAQALLIDALASSPEDRTLRIALADLYRRTEQFEAAITFYDMVIAEDDKADWTLFYGRGIAQEQSGHFASAEADLRQALELRPNDPYILNYLGYSLLDRGLKEEEAQQMIDTAVSARPNDGFIVDSQGWAAYHRGDYDAAVELLERAVSLQPGDPTINDHLGDAYWKTGRVIEARFKWQQVLTMEPTTIQEETITTKLDLGLTLAESTNTDLPTIE